MAFHLLIEKVVYMTQISLGVDDVKHEVEKVLNDIGLSMSTAIEVTNNVDIMKK